MDAGRYRIDELNNCEGNITLGDGSAELEFSPYGESVLIVYDGASNAAKLLDTSKIIPIDGFVARTNDDQLINLGRVSWKSGEQTEERKYSLRDTRVLLMPQG